MDRSGTTNFRWEIAPRQDEAASAVAARLGVSSLTGQCLLNRGHSTPASAARFLSPRLRELADPYLIPNMQAAVERLWQAKEGAEPVVIFGDYDVDGVTASALLYELFTALGWAVHCYLPRRLEEGYGLSREGLENCLRRYPTRLILAVDCGSTATENVRWLKQSGIDVIVLDHHQISAPPPDAVALVNPQIGAGSGATGCVGSDFQELCSVGLAFKLAHAILKRARSTNIEAAFAIDLRESLDLVALGTIADLVPLIGENRILVSAGIQRVRFSKRIGLSALRTVAQTPEAIGPYEIGYQLAPRLNAAGRLENAEAALRLLLTVDPSEGGQIARELDDCNRERQQLERRIAEEAIAGIREHFDHAVDYVIVEGQAAWHVGVVGIVASRVLREFYRPTIILGGGDCEWRGSGRSINGFDLAGALRECGDLLVRHGGHAMAAGLAILPERVPELRRRLNDWARRSLPAEALIPVVRIDAEIELGELTEELLAEFARLEPMGQANPPVQLLARRLCLTQPPKRMGREMQHLRFYVADGPASCQVVWWNGGAPPGLGLPFDLVFAPQINEFNGQRSVQLKLLDWRPSDARG